MDPGNRWFYLVGGRRHGPVALTGLVDQVLHGQLPPGTLVWRRGFAEWTPAEAVAEIAVEIPPPPPPATQIAVDGEGPGEPAEVVAPAAVDLPEGLPSDPSDGKEPVLPDPSAHEAVAGERQAEGEESPDGLRRRHRRHRHHRHHREEEAPRGARRWVDLLVPIGLVLTLLLFLAAGACRLFGPGAQG